MTHPNCTTVLRCLTAALLFAVSGVAGLSAAERKAFDIAAGTAEQTLKLFAAQSSAEVIYPVEIVRGVKTPAIKGAFTAREALERMFAGTSVTVTQDPTSGTLSLVRATAPNVPRAAPAKRSDRPEQGDGSDLVRLSSFVVESDRDYGYRAANSITATGIGTRISDIPVAISVLTNDFLEDQDGTLLKEVMNFVPGVTPFGRDDAQSVFSIRGFQAQLQVNGFNEPVSISTASVDRIEVIKGPSAVFNGLITPGGVINIIYKKPDFSPNTFLKLDYGSYKFARGEIFSTGPIVGDKLAYLANISVKGSNSWRDWTGDDETTRVAALTFRATPAMSLTASFRKTEARQQLGSYLTTSHTGFATSNASVNTTLQTWVAANFGSNEPSSNLIVQNEMYPSGFRSNANGPENYQDTTSATATLELTLKVNAHVEFSNKYYNNTTDRASAKINNAFRTRAGLVLIDPAQYQKVLQEVVANRSELALHLAVGSITSAMSLGFEYSRTASSTVGNRQAPASVWNPRRDAPRMVQRELRAAFPNGVPLQRPSDFNLDAFYVAEQASAFDNRLRVLIGARHMNAVSVSSRDAVSRPGFRTVDKKVTPQVAVLARPFGGTLKDTSFFVNYSESFEPSGTIDVRGEVLPTVTGTGTEIGLKTDWNDGVLSGTISVFRNERTNISQRDFVLENQLRIQPLYNLGGAQRSEGIECDLIWTPARWYQAAVNYAWIPSAKTTAQSSDPNQVGVRFDRLPEHKFNVSNKLTLVQGPLKGAFVGGSVVVSSRYRLHGSWQIALWGPGYLEADVFAGYRATLLRRKTEWRLHVANIFDRGGFSFDYTPNHPRRMQLTVKTSL
jgi:iron complex outermembrane recepter protein